VQRIKYIIGGVHTVGTYLIWVAIILFVVFFLTPFLNFINRMFPSNQDRQIVGIYMQMQTCSAQEVFERAKCWYKEQHTDTTIDIDASFELKFYKKNSNGVAKRKI